MELVSQLLPLIAIFAIFWLLVIRPAQRRQKAVRNVQQQLSVGDSVLTNSGILGTVASVEDTEIGLEVADGVVVRLARGAVVAVESPADQAEDAGESTLDEPALDEATPHDTDRKES